METEQINPSVNNYKYKYKNAVYLRYISIYIFICIM